MDIIISTGDVRQNYEIIDTIFALDSHKAGFFSTAEPHKAFAGVTKQLKDQCKKLKGNAVINCQFEYRNALDSGVFGSKQVIEIFAYGTVVRLMQ